MISSPIFIAFVSLIAIVEFVVLVRHNVFRNALIERRIIRQESHERSDYHCLLGWENTLEKLDYKADICFFGNSITMHSDFQKEFPQKKIINLGYSGDGLEGMIIRHKQIEAVHPEKVFIMAGINDLTNKHITIEAFRSLYEELIDSIQCSNPCPQIYLESILPVNHDVKKGLTTAKRIVEANQIIESIAKQRGLIYIDLYPLFVDENLNLKEQLTTDGLHLCNEGYHIWRDAIKDYIMN